MTTKKGDIVRLTVYEHGAPAGVAVDVESINPHGAISYYWATKHGLMRFHASYDAYEEVPDGPRY